ncbi:MAG TPA: lysine--tRNA ligase [Chloroflexota bacterium]|jgi:lysyl-tRNA synthetase class 2|nr:lysine--tRNA ligase [Chloroflexota bacterium]
MTDTTVDRRQQRRQKLVQLKEIGLPFHPTTFEPTTSARELQEGYPELEGKTVTIAGRMAANNRMGRAAFVRVQDASGRIQLHLKRDLLGEQLWQYYRLLDLGDLVGATGTVFKTNTGEVTVEVRELILLQKAYLPLPEKFHGLSDVETRFRQRYLDLIANPESRDVARKRSLLITGVRGFLDARAFLEVETPILQPIYGGGAANPFVTHLDLFDMDLYLRIADELYLKRLIVGGLERVYEIAKDFRNEGFSRKHSQEFTMLELYQAYADYEDMMRLLEEMVASVAVSIGAGDSVRAGEETIRIAAPWERITFDDAMRKYAQLDVDSVSTRESLLVFGREHGVVVSAEMSRGALLDQIWSARVEPHLIQPTIVKDYPVDFPGSIFARGAKDREDKVERFEAFIGGIEIANAFTEMNDPYEQEARLDLMARTAGIHLDAAERDQDFITALEYGMPPTGGMGVGMDRLAMILTESDHIRETILFPLLKRRDEVIAES